MGLGAGQIVLDTDIDTLELGSSQKPLCRLVQSVAQSIPNNTATAVTFTGSEDIDTHGFHDPVTNTDRITPTVPGYYRITAVFTHAARTDANVMRLEIAKNGTAVPPAMRWVFPSSVSPNGVMSYRVEAIQTANGTTDFFNLLALLSNTAATATLTSVGGSTTPVIECEYLRGL